MDSRETLYAEIVKAGVITLKGTSDKNPDEVDVDRRVTVRMFHTEEKEGILFGNGIIEVYADFTDENAMTEHLYVNSAWNPGDTEPEDQLGYDSKYGIMLCSRFEMFEGYYCSCTTVYVYY